MDYFIICLVAFLTSILTFFSGFGLGTILMPVFALFFPTELAIALTGVVHFFNNIFKLFLVGNKADKSVLIRFGIPAIIAAFLGAWLLLNITDIWLKFYITDIVSYDFLILWNCAFSFFKYYLKMKETHTSVNIWIHLIWNSFEVNMRSDFSIIPVCLFI